MYPSPSRLGKIRLCSISPCIGNTHMMSKVVLLWVNYSGCCCQQLAPSLTTSLHLSLNLQSQVVLTSKCDWSGERKHIFTATDITQNKHKYECKRKQINNNQNKNSHTSHNRHPLIPLLPQNLDESRHQA